MVQLTPSVSKSGSPVPNDGVMEQQGMAIAEVLAVLDAVRSTGCRFWLEGGWGVDALVGRQTRPHRDVDVDFDADYEDEVLQALSLPGYFIETEAQQG